jgi:hypothetical protein
MTGIGNIDQSWARRFFNRRFFLTLAAIILVLILAPFLRPRDIATHESALRQELSTIEAPPSARLVDTYDKPNLRHALVSRTYRSDLNYNALKKYYIPQLRAKCRIIGDGGFSIIPAHTRENA